MRIVQRGKLYVLYDLNGKVVIISRDRRVCQSFIDDMAEAQMTTKKLQEDSKFNQFDTDGDGIV